jgi:alpha-glucosidase
MNGPVQKSVQIPLSFLGSGEYQAMLVRDVADDPAAVKIEKITVNKKQSLAIELRAGGGFIGRFSREARPGLT